MQQSYKFPSLTDHIQTTTDRRAVCNSTYPKGWVSCSKDSFVVKALKGIPLTRKDEFERMELFEEKKYWN